MGLQTLSVYFYWKKKTVSKLKKNNILQHFFLKFYFLNVLKRYCTKFYSKFPLECERNSLSKMRILMVSLKNPYNHVRFYSTKFNLESSMKLLSKNRIFAVSDEKIRIFTWKCCANIMYSFKIWCSIQWKCSVPFFMVEC